MVNFRKTVPIAACVIFKFLLIITSGSGDRVEISDLIDVESKDFENIVSQAGWMSQWREFEEEDAKVESGKSFQKTRNDSADMFFLKRVLYNASGITYTPLFSFLLPGKASPGDGSTVDLSNQAIFALFTILCMVSSFLIPVFLTGSRDPPGQSRSLSSISFSSKISNPRNKVFNFMGKKISNQIGLDKELCLQNIICEAHRHPDKYDMIGLPFRRLFPASELRNRTGGLYSSAANYGKYETKKCQEKYKCFFDLLDLTLYFVELFKYSRSHPGMGLANDLNYLR